MSIGTVGAVVLGGSTLLGAGASLIGAGKQADAATQAANAQLTATREGLAFQREQADKAFSFMAGEKERLEPFRLLQLRALSNLEALADPNSREAQLERSQGVQSIQRTLAAQGLLRSSAQGEGLQNLELGLANRRSNLLSLIAGSGGGLASANFGQNIGQSLLNQGNQIGSSIANQGAIAGQGILARGAASAQGIAGLNNAIQGGVGNALQLMLLSKLGGGKVA